LNSRIEQESTDWLRAKLPELFSAIEAVSSSRRSFEVLRNQLVKEIEQRHVQGRDSSQLVENSYSFEGWTHRPSLFDQVLDLNILIIRTLTELEQVLHDEGENLLTEVQRQLAITDVNLVDIRYLAFSASIKLLGPRTLFAQNLVQLQKAFNDFEQIVDNEDEFLSRFWNRPFAMYVSEVMLCCQGVIEKSKKLQEAKVGGKIKAALDVDGQIQEELQIDVVDNLDKGGQRAVMGNVHTFELQTEHSAASELNESSLTTDKKPEPSIFSSIEMEVFTDAGLQISEVLKLIRYMPAKEAVQWAEDFGHDSMLALNFLRLGLGEAVELEGFEINEVQKIAADVAERIRFSILQDFDVYTD
jgi:hypothetical protein